MTIATTRPETTATPRRMSLEEYLTHDDGTDTRYELEDGVLVEMGVESTINTWIAMYLAFAFGALGYPLTELASSRRFRSRVNMPQPVTLT